MNELEEKISSITTDISKLTFRDSVNMLDDYSFDELDEDNFESYVTNWENPENIRIKVLEKIMETSNDILLRLIGMFRFSNVSILKKFLVNIVLLSKIDLEQKMLVVEEICERDSKTGIELILSVSDNFEEFDKISFLKKINFVSKLSKLEKFSELENILSTLMKYSSIDDDYRYKSILSIENPKVRTSVAYSFLTNNENRTRYRILSSQLILGNEEGESIRKNVENQIISFMNDNDLDVFLRADAADVLLHYSPEHYDMAREMILLLGVDRYQPNTIYENRQNVHNEELEDSVNEILEFLASFPTMKINGHEIEINQILAKISNNTEGMKETRKEKIDYALNRISIDSALYGKFNMTLGNILVKVWGYMKSSKNEELIYMRLLEELEEMSGTCSTGYASRLVNCLSGITDFSVRISWCDQIIANFAGRLNRRAREIEDSDYQGDVFMEMSCPYAPPESRKNFLKFFRENMLSIREEMYEEFRDYMDDTTYDLYFKRAISNYVVGDS